MGRWLLVGFRILVAQQEERKARGMYIDFMRGFAGERQMSPLLHLNLSVPAKVIFLHAGIKDGEGARYRGSGKAVWLPRSHQPEQWQPS